MRARARVRARTCVHVRVCVGGYGLLAMGLRVRTHGTSVALALPLAWGLRHKIFDKFVGGANLNVDVVWPVPIQDSMW